MTERLRTVAKTAALGVTAVTGCLLFAISPMLLFIAAWAGSDGGSVTRGILFVFGLPWLIYLVCAGGVAALLAYRLPRPALPLALVQIYPALRLVRLFVR